MTASVSVKEFMFNKVKGCRIATVVQWNLQKSKKEFFNTEKFLETPFSL